MKYLRYGQYVCQNLIMMIVTIILTNVNNHTTGKILIKDRHIHTHTIGRQTNQPLVFKGTIGNFEINIGWRNGLETQTNGWIRDTNRWYGARGNIWKEETVWDQPSSSYLYMNFIDWAERLLLHTKGIPWRKPSTATSRHGKRSFNVNLQFIYFITFSFVNIIFTFTYYQLLPRLVFGRLWKD